MIPQVVDRSQLIQSFIDRLGAGVYLEIGVFDATTFKAIECRKKIAVDPNFFIGAKKRFKHTLRQFISGRVVRWKPLTSDAFFATHESYLITNPPMVVFIDGLHTFEQTLRDCCNALNFLAHGGVIVLHDCNPPHQASATPAQSIPEARRIYESQYDDGSWTGEWCGDTWKTIPYLIKNHPELEVCVLDADYGLGIVYKKSDMQALPRPYAPTPQRVEQFLSLGYADLEKNRATLLNLKKVTDLGDAMAVTGFGNPN